MSNNVEKEAYIGSVRFFKHLILSTVGLLILVPVCICVLLGIQNKILREEVAVLHREMVHMQQEGEFLEEPPVSQEEAVIEETTEMEVAEEEEIPEEILMAERIVSQTEEWALLLVNGEHPLSEDFEVELVKINGGQKVDVRIEEALKQMMKDMEAEGLRPLVCSGYRDIEKQAKLQDEFIREKKRAGRTYTQAFHEAKVTLALPGFSEHHTGLAVDIVGMDHQSLDAKQASTAEAQWLKEHCAEYGFILRYPEDKTEITGIAFESWHFRYVGKEAAAYIMEEQITLEEFLEIANR